MSNSKDDPDLPVERESCPCKRVPLCLSTFTAAEHGNVDALLARRDGGIRAIAGRQDAAGNTPLHLAAQHGHVAVVSVLLNSGCCNVNAAGGGATALHRASFSGAVGTIRLLVEVQDCDLLVRDTSFGDQATPLHKACLGGRYLAVQLLLETLQLRSEKQGNNELLRTALLAADANGKTPIDVASQKAQQHEAERKNVLRWNAVARGEPDWDKCVQLLKRYSESSGDSNPSSKQISKDYATASKPLPDHLRRTMEDDGCADCSAENGRCLTASWEQSFRAALLYSLETNIKGSENVEKRRNPEISLSDRYQKTRDEETNQHGVVVQKDNTKYATLPNTATASSTAAHLGRDCDICGKRTVAVYPREGGNQLVCKRCKYR